MEGHAPPLALVLLDGVLESERLVAEVAAVRVLGQVAGHVSGQLLLGLGPVRAVRAGVLPITVLGYLGANVINRFTAVGYEFS